MAKDESSAYVSGQSRRWLKVKVGGRGLGGIVRTDGHYTGLIVGEMSGGELSYVGTVE